MTIVERAQFNVMVCISTYEVHGTAGKCVQLGEQLMTPRDFKVKCGKGGSQKWAESLRVGDEANVAGLGVGKWLEQHGVVKASSKREQHPVAGPAQSSIAKKSWVDTRVL